MNLGIVYTVKSDGSEPPEIHSKMNTNIHILHLERVLDVDHVAGDKSVLADAGRPLKNVAVVLSDERGPVGVVGTVEVDGEEAVVGRATVRSAMV